MRGPVKGTTPVSLNFLPTQPIEVIIYTSHSIGQKGASAK